MRAVHNLRIYIKLDNNVGKESTFEFAHILVEIFQMYTMHNLPHRAQVMRNESNLTVAPFGRRFHSLSFFRPFLSTGGDLLTLKKY